MESFLKYYAALNKLKKKTESISEDPGSENEEIDAPDDEKSPCMYPVRSLVAY